MDRKIKLHALGMEMLATRYSYWHSGPRETAVAMLDYCACIPDDMRAVNETLTRDSQAGIDLSQENVQRNDDIQASDLEELKRHLQNHDIIQKADFEVANTLKL